MQNITSPGVRQFVRRVSQRKLRVAGIAALTAAALTAAGCGSSGAPPSSTSGGKPVTDRTALVALRSGITYNWIFPFYGITNASVYNTQQFQWRSTAPTGSI